MGYHSDNEPELGPRPTIASVSLGDRRRFVLRHRASRERWSWDLGEGDLLVMRAESQSDYAHAIPKTSRQVGPSHQPHLPVLPAANPEKRTPAGASQIALMRRLRHITLIEERSAQVLAIVLQAIEMLAAAKRRREQH